jgi:hypothetical protein
MRIHPKNGMFMARKGYSRSAVNPSHRRDTSYMRPMTAKTKAEQARPGRPATRPPPQRRPEGAATPEQEAYISSARLRQKLLELNP